MRLTRHRGAHAAGNRRAANDVLPGPDARSRFGGLDLPAAFAGTMAALGSLALLGAIATSWFNASDQELTRDDVMSTAGVAVALGIVLVSSLFGGWVTGRTSRYEGAGNGLLSGLLLILLSVGVVALGVSQDGTSQAIPSWITDDAASSAALIAAGVAVAVALFGAVLGGLLGSGWHRRVDRALVRDVENRDFTPYPDERDESYVDSSERDRADTST